MYQETEPVPDQQPVEPTEYQQPVQPTSYQAPVEPIKPTKKSSNKLIIHILSILILGSIFAGGAYLWRDKTANEAIDKKTADMAVLQTAKSDLEKQLADEQASNIEVVADETACTTSESPVATVIENIKASITSGNTAALEGYMADSVNTILAATEAYGPQTPAQSVSAITSFIADATSPWDFALSASILSSYGSGGYEQYFPNNAVVGKSANGKVISFAFDCDAKISTVFMSISDELLAQ